MTSLTRPGWDLVDLSLLTTYASLAESRNLGSPMENPSRSREPLNLCLRNPNPLLAVNIPYSHIVRIDVAQVAALTHTAVEQAAAVAHTIIEQGILG